jgi:transcriptional regulator with XRE-family HTH domain
MILGERIREMRKSKNLTQEIWLTRARLTALHWRSGAQAKGIFLSINSVKSPTRSDVMWQL